MVAPYKDKQKDKFATSTWSIRKIAVTAKPDKTKLQIAHEEPGPSKPDRPQS